MAQPIQFDFQVPQLQQLATQLERLEKVRVALSKTVEIKVAKGQNIRKEIDETQALVKQKQQLQRAQGQLSVSRTKEAKEILRTRQAISQLRSEHNQEIKAERAAAGSVDQLSAKLALLKKQYRAAGQAGRRDLLPQIKTLDTRVKKLDGAIGNNQRNVGNYSGAFGDLKGNLAATAGAMFGVTAAIGVATKLVQGAVTTVKDFQQANANLASILGTTRSEIGALTEDSKRLGASTKFTAVEVAGLQTELAKLGFTEQEIVDATESILSLAAATNTELPQAAKQVGSALRAFGLDASEATRVTDVFAKATSSSALNMSFLDTAMSKVAPVAKAFGFSIEESSALLGSLADAGFDASTAATSTRSILLNLADANGKLAKELGRPVESLDDLVPALIELRESGVDLNTTLQLTDKRSVAAFNTFLEGAEKVEVLNAKLEQAAGTAEAMADEQLNTLSGAATKVTSAWDGLILSLVDGEGFIGGALQLSLETFGELLNNISLLFSDSTSTSDKFIIALNLLIERVLDLIPGMKELAVQLGIFEDFQFGTTQEALEAIDDRVKDLTATQKQNVAIARNLIDLYVEQGLSASEAAERLIALGVGLKVIEGGSGDAAGGLDFLGDTLASLRAQLKLLQEQREGILETDKESLASNEQQTRAIQERIKALEISTAKEKSLRDKRKAEEAEANTDELRFFKARQETIKRVEKADNDRFKKIKKQNDQEIANLKKTIQEERRLRDAAEQQKLDNINKVADATRFASDAAFQIAQNRIEAELIETQNESDKKLEILEKQFESGQITQMEFDEKTKALDEQTAKETAALKTKQAKLDKANALIQVAINTASAVALGIAQFGPPPSPPGLAAIAAALSIGGVQAAVIASQPIPQFAEGVIGLEGPGTGKSDSITARLSRGESVMTADETGSYREDLYAMRESMKKGKTHYREFVINKYLYDSQELKSAGQAKEKAFSDNLAQSIAFNSAFTDKNLLKASKMGRTLHRELNSDLIKALTKKKHGQGW